MAYYWTIGVSVSVSVSVSVVSFQYAECTTVNSQRQKRQSMCCTFLQLVDLRRKLSY